MPLIVCIFNIWLVVGNFSLQDVSGMRLEDDCVLTGGSAHISAAAPASYWLTTNSSFSQRDFHIHVHRERRPLRGNHIGVVCRNSPLRSHLPSLDSRAYGKPQRAGLIHTHREKERESLPAVTSLKILIAVRHLGVGPLMLRPAQCSALRRDQ